MLYAILSLFSIAQVDVTPLRETAPAQFQTDDPAIWIHPTRPAESMVFGTIKTAAPNGAIAVYSLQGRLLMTVSNVDRPNNIDVAYGLKLGSRTIDIAVATERNQNRLRVFEVVPGKGLVDLASIPVFSQPMGIALYTRPRDKAIFAVVSRKSGPSGTYLWQYRLHADSRGQLNATKEREFGEFSGSKEIEAVTIDNELSHIYYSDEGAGIRKYHADPAHPNASRQIALIGATGWTGDREGLAIYHQPRGKGFLIATDQQTPNSVYHVFSRETNQELGSFRIGAATTDGIEVTNRPLGVDLPRGLFIAMNDSRKNFIFVDWRKIESALKLLQ